MTTIIGVQGGGFSLICGDSRVSAMDESGSSTMSITMLSGHSKLCANGRYLFGVAGDMRAINIVQHAFNPPQPAALLKGKKLDAFVTTKFIPALRSCFEEQGYSTPSDKEGRPQQIQQNSSLVISINSTIYQIDGDYAWCSDVSGIYAAGTGAPYALGALQALIGKTLTAPQAKKAVLRAMSIAARYDPYTGPPFSVLMQEAEKGLSKSTRDRNA